MKKKVVAFDFDGVLADTLRDAFELHVKRNPNLTWEMFMKISHGNWWKMIESEEVAASFHVPEEHVHEYREMLSNVNMRKEIDTAIRNLYEKGYQLAIVTSGSEISVRGYLEREKILDCFSDILGFDTHKSKVEKFKLLLQKYLLQPSDIVFITDTLGDILEANELGIRSIGDTWGLHDQETLEHGKPEAIIDDPTNLEETIERVLNS